MDTYEVHFKENETEGVYAISLVDSPAMESQFIALSEQKEITLKAIDAEKRILLGAVLIPNKPIYRKQDGKEFNITFPEKTIQLTMENFFKKGYQNNSTLEHNEELKLQDVTFVESWIKESEVDKSVHYGFNEPNGTWFASMKVNNDEVWNDFVKTGKVKGFSIDGFFDLEKINLKSEFNMSELKNESLVDSFKTALSEFFSPKKKDGDTEVKLGSVMTKDGTLTIEFDGDTIAIGTEMYLVNDTGEKLPVPDGEYTLEDDMTAVMENSKVKELKPATEVPENKEPVAMDQNPTSEPTGTTVKSEKFTQEVFYQLAKVVGTELDKFKTELEKFKTELRAEFKTELSSEKEKAISLTKLKGDKKIDWENLTPLEKFRLSKNNI
jgi:hypothetical protein